MNLHYHSESKGKHLHFSRSTIIAVACGLGAVILGGVGIFWWGENFPIDQAGEDASANVSKIKWWWRGLFYVYRLAKLLELHISEGELNNPAWLLAALLAIVATVALAFSILMSLFDEFKLFMLKYHGEHVVVCGLGHIGSWVAKEMLRQGNKVVVIEKKENETNAREMRKLGAIVIEGDASDPEMLDWAEVSHAKRVFAVTDSFTVNASIAARLSKPRSASCSKKDRPICHVYASKPAEMDLLRLSPAFSRSDRGVDVQMINLQRMGSHHLLGGIIKTPAILPKGEEVAHYFLFGFGSMGRTVAQELAQLAHFGNMRRSRMTIFDKAIEGKAATFLDMFPSFCPQPGRLDLSKCDKNIDRWDVFNPEVRPVESARAEFLPGTTPVEYACNAEFKELSSFGGTELTRVIRERMLPGVVKPVFIICFDEEKTNFEAALQMRAQLRDICETAEVFAWMPRLENIHRLLETSAEEKVRITRFGHPENVMDWGYLIEDKLERLARKAHEDYRESELKKIDGRRMPVWEELTVESLYRRSNEQQALHIDTKLSVIGLKRVDVSKLAGRPQAEISKEDAQLLAEIEHNRWMGERLMGGWRYGAVRNDAARIHWNLVPYGALDKDTRDKDLKPCMEIPNSLREVDECVVRI